MRTTLPEMLRISDTIWAARAALDDVAIQRRRDVHSALTWPTLGPDWPITPTGGSPCPSARDHRCAPDVFGVQLLGPGYADDLPALRALNPAAWTVESVAGGGTLVSATDASPWFSDAFSTEPPDGRGDPPSPPRVLRDARAALSFLMCPGA